MDNKYEERLGTASMLPLILKMALPGFAAQLINLLYSIVDRVFIGHIELIGTDALAGIGVTSSIIILISAFSQIVGGGGAPLASIALGKGDRERAHRILGNGFSLLVLFAVVTSGITYIFMEPPAPPYRCKRRYYRLCHRLPLGIPYRHAVRNVRNRT